MADSITKLIQLNTSFAKVLIAEIFFSFLYLTLLMFILEHSIIDLQCVKSMTFFYLLWFMLRYFPDGFSDFSFCFLVFSFDVIYFVSSGLYAATVLFYFYSVQPCLLANLQKQSLEFVFMHFYVLLSGFFVNLVLDAFVSILRYFLIAFSA